MIVDLLPNEDQNQILDSVRGFLAEALPVERLRDEAATHGRAEAGIWGDLTDLGLFGLGVSEARGGVGYGLAEEALVAREFGRFLVSPDVLATMLACEIAEDVDRQALIAGDRRVALAAPVGDGGLHLFDGLDAAWVLTPMGLEPLLDLGPLQDRSGLDETVRLRRTDSGRLGLRSADDRLVRRGQALMTCYLTGLAEAAKDISVAYVKVREQFGQPIGGFQAVKHHCADMAVRAEAVTAQVLYTALALEAGLAEVDADLEAARLLACEAALENGRVAIQLHGGMGFTYECDAHFYLKRAHVLSRIVTGWSEAMPQPGPA